MLTYARIVPLCIEHPPTVMPFISETHCIYRHPAIYPQSVHTITDDCFYILNRKTSFSISYAN